MFATMTSNGSRHTAMSLPSRQAEHQQLGCHAVKLRVLGGCEQRLIVVVYANRSRFQQGRCDGQNSRTTTKVQHTLTALYRPSHPTQAHPGRGVTAASKCQSRDQGTSKLHPSRWFFAPPTSAATISAHQTVCSTACCCKAACQSPARRQNRIHNGHALQDPSP